MKIKYDPSVDILYIRVSDKPIAESDDSTPGFIRDLDEDGETVGIEVLDASTRVSHDALPMDFTFGRIEEKQIAA